MSPLILARLMTATAVILLLSFVVANGLTAAEPASRVWRIMPIGDSITEGGSSFVVYHVPLFERLTAAGYRVTFVGSRTAPTKVGPLAHEGYGGKNAEFLATVVPKSFREHPADVALIHAGHNHFAEERPVPGIVAATETIITGMRVVNPQVIVLLAQVIPSAKQPKYSYHPDLNRALAELAQRLTTAASPVLIVDQTQGFDPVADTVADQVHPNQRGADKMAAAWFAALTRVLGPIPKKGTP
jgi:lysophospholipase L1-like esterase